MKQYYFNWTDSNGKQCAFSCNSDNLNDAFAQALKVDRSILITSNLHVNGLKYSIELKYTVKPKSPTKEEIEKTRFKWTNEGGDVFRLKYLQYEAYVSPKQYGFEMLILENGLYVTGKHGTSALATAESARQLVEKYIVGWLDIEKALTNA